MALPNETVIVSVSFCLIILPSSTDCDITISLETVSLYVSIISSSILFFSTHDLTYATDFSTKSSIVIEPTGASPLDISITKLVPLAKLSSVTFLSLYSITVPCSTLSL